VNVALGSPVRETCMPGSAGGGRHKGVPRPPSTQHKIKVLKRMGYGYRDDGYFFLKIHAAFPGIPENAG
jgi:hypothetical protein